MEIEPVELAWLAGLLEGEGSFTSRRNRNHPDWRVPGIVLAMSDRDVVERVGRIWERNVSSREKPKYPHWSRIFRVEIWGWPAVDWMRVLHPHMGERRTAKIEEYLNGPFVANSLRLGDQSRANQKLMVEKNRMPVDKERWS